MLNNTPTGATTVSRPTVKGQKVGGGPIPGKPRPFPKIVGIILPLISLWNYARSTEKLTHTPPPRDPGLLAFWECARSVECASPRAALAVWDGPHSVYGVWISLNKSTSVFCCCCCLFDFGQPSGMWDPSSRTRDRTHAPCSGSTASQPLDHQGSPNKSTSYLSLWLSLNSFSD